MAEDRRQRTDDRASFIHAASTLLVAEKEPNARGHLCPLSSVLCPPTSRKEVIQPQVPLRLPCYDFTPVADLTVVGYFPRIKSAG